MISVITQKKKLRTNAWLLVALAIASSVCMYLILATIFGFTNILRGVLVSFFIPAVVSIPVAFLVAKYQRSLMAQNLELRRLNRTNKKIFNAISTDIQHPLRALSLRMGQ
ncbi:MAG: hypothetical protein JJ975_16070, partial [Bacteroidia bacterium]|nr:hypothetical protein [Bacteroidia bacterium]